MSLDGAVAMATEVPVGSGEQLHRVSRSGTRASPFLTLDVGGVDPSFLGNRGQTNYAAAKAGIQGMTKTLALELRRFGVRANCVTPGVVETQTTHAIAERAGRPWEEINAELAANIPLRRVGQLRDIAEAIAFLPSEAAGWITGQVLYVRGGVISG